MKYDFTNTPIRKDVGAIKWDLMYNANPEEGSDIIPFSVADMEFRNPPELLEGMSKYALTSVYGYTGPTPAYFNSIIRFMKERHDWDIKNEWIVMTSGVVPALYQLVNAFTKPGEGVIIMRPVYYPFSSAIEQTGRELVNVALIESNGKYTIDFDALEKAAAAPNTKMMIFCSPHNPVGRVWTREELLHVAKICIDNNVLIVSDEIHFDFIMKDCKHTILATLSDEIAQHTILCTAPSKSFNLGGVQVSNIIIPNEIIRKKYIEFIKAGGFFTLNTFAFKACELVYNNCCGWLDELLDVLEENKKLMEKYLADNIPEVHVTPLEGTYLMWLDFRKLGMSDEELQELMEKKAHLYFDKGDMFGPEGKGFERWNIACPKEKLIEGLERLNKAIKEFKDKGDVE